jgi:DNA-binding response OmpR family regulator
MASMQGDSKTVLIADDDDWLREMLTLLLVDEGFCPLQARNGPETVRLAGKLRPDVILLDVDMPGRSGIRVLADLRKASATRDIPVMLVSGEINIFETGHASEANATFHKPLDFCAFLNKVHEATSDNRGKTGSADG